MSLWQRYVAKVADGVPQKEIGRVSGVYQGTVSRWKTGESVPDDPAVVASFARSFDRNVLEAFVAAEMLTADEAGRGLSMSERQFLDELTSQVQAEGETPEVFPRGGRFRTEGRAQPPGAGPS